MQQESNSVEVFFVTGALCRSGEALMSAPGALIDFAGATAALGRNWRMAQTENEGVLSLSKRLLGVVVESAEVPMLAGATVIGVFGGIAMFPVALALQTPAVVEAGVRELITSPSLEE